MYSYEEALKDSIKYFQHGQDDETSKLNAELAGKVFVDKYALRDRNDNLLECNPDQMHRRMAKEFARIEAKKFETPYNEEFIYNLFKNFERIIPQGGPMSGIGNTEQYVSLSNCFIGGTKVFTTNGIKNIEDIIVNEDNTVSEDGSINKIVQLHKNKINNRTLFDVKVSRTPKFTVTNNHEFLSISKEQLEFGYKKPVWNTISYLREGDYIAIPNRIELEQEIKSIDLDSLYNTNENIEKLVSDTDITLKTIWLNKNGKKLSKLHNSINRLWKLDNDFYYFIGLWYGDGCVFSDKKTCKRDRLNNSKNLVRGITFTFSSNENKLINFVCEYGQKLFGIKPDINDNSIIDGSTQIVFHSRLVGEVFEILFGRRCDGKRFHKSMFSLPKEQFINLVQGLVDSDGCITTNGNIKVVLKNRKLLEEFHHTCRSLNIPSTLIYSSNDKYARFELVQYSSFLKNSNKFYEDNRIKTDKEESSNRILKLGGYTLLRIEKKTINIKEYEYVYTLGIENIHSYSVEGLISLNCYVLESPEDSYGGILKTDQQLVQISKRRGGVGIDLDNLRPKGTPTTNSSRTSTGIISWMTRYSNSIREVGQGGRRGALMLTLSVHHPDILDFATVKNDGQQVTGANISAKLTDEFLQAVKEDKYYELRWPVNSPSPVIRKYAKARDIWKTIIHSAWFRAEPGLLFWDNILRESPADCYSLYRTISTNPCSEIPLSFLDSCRLLVLNLFYYVKNAYTNEAYFDYDAFYGDVKIAQRLMDDLIDIELEHIERIISKIESDPEDSFTKSLELETWKKIHKACEDGRRTGLGPTALADTMAACGIKYGTEVSIEFVDKVYKTLKLGAYHSSVDMAKELGPFNVFDAEKEKDCAFLNRFKDEKSILHCCSPGLCESWIEGKDIYEYMQQYGRRNIALLTTAPTGTTSIVASLKVKNKYYHNVSAGIEPVFMLSYTRKKKGNPGDKDFRIDSVDQSGDSWMHFKVYHSGLAAFVDVTGKDEQESSYFGACAQDIDWINRVKLQASAQKHIDHAISSTINLPNDVSEEVVAKIYETAWEYGLKGITVYRDGCRTGVLVKEDKPPEVTIKRPKDLTCDIHHFNMNEKEYFVIIGLLNDKPYEIFIGNNISLHTEEDPKRIISKKTKSGIVRRTRKSEYSLMYEDNILCENITHYCSSDMEALARLTSLSLRHQSTDLHFIVQQLEKVKGGMNAICKLLARALKKHIPDGLEIKGEQCPDCKGKLIRQEGCISCQNCSYSKCS